MHRALLLVSALAYGISVFSLASARGRHLVLEVRWYRGLLCLGLVSHAAYILMLVWWLRRPPFFGRAELLSWFAFGCAAICLVGTRWLYSRFVLVWGAASASFVMFWLMFTYRTQGLPDMAALHTFTAWWYGFATPLGCAAVFLAFPAALRARVSALRNRARAEPRVRFVSEESMGPVALALVRLGYPLLLTGLIVFLLEALEAVGRAWLWQRSVAAQIFALVVYTIYLHLSASEPAPRARTFVAQTAAFCGVVVCVLSFDLPQSLLSGLGLGLFL